MRLQLGVPPVRPDDAVTKEYADTDTLGFPSMSNREIPVGALDGTNATFILDHTPVAGSEMVFVNGLMQQSGDNSDYTIVGAVITFLTPPPLNTDIAVTYWFIA